MSSLGTGASGLGQQLADLIGGLLGSSDNGMPGSSDLDPPASPIHRRPADHTTTPNRDADDSAVDDEAGTPQTEDAQQIRCRETGAAEDRARPRTAPAATPVPPQPEPAPPIPPAVPEAAPAAKTPCEIAADELPQVGE